MWLAHWLLTVFSFLHPHVAEWQDILCASREDDRAGARAIRWGTGVQRRVGLRECTVNTVKGKYFHLSSVGADVSLNVQSLYLGTVNQPALHQAHGDLRYTNSDRP